MENNTNANDRMTTKSFFVLETLATNYNKQISSIDSP